MLNAKLKKQHYILIAISVVIIAILIFASSAKASFRLGNYYFGGGAYNISVSKTFFNLAYKIDDKHPGLNYQLARIYFIEGKFDEALTYINREIEYYPEFKRSYYVRALIHGYNNNLAQAADDFKIFLAWKPSSWAGNNDLSWIYFRMGDYAKAEKAASDGLSSSPNNGWLLNSLGVALLNQGKYKEAAIALQSSLTQFKALNPEDWGQSYPGNDPEIYAGGLTATIKSVETNLNLALEKEQKEMGTTSSQTN